MYIMSILLYEKTKKIFYFTDCLYDRIDYKNKLCQNVLTRPEVGI